MSSVSSVKQIQHLRGSSFSFVDGTGPGKEICLSRCWCSGEGVEEGGLFRSTVCESSEVVDGLLVGCSCELRVGELGVD